MEHAGPPRQASERINGITYDTAAAECVAQSTTHLGSEGKTYREESLYLGDEGTGSWWNVAPTCSHRELSRLATTMRCSGAANMA